MRTRISPIEIEPVKCCVFLCCILLRCNKSELSRNSSFKRSWEFV